ncbi:MAG: heavy-metal-associated domain-containing protein [Acidobacteria bacterium]|nr:heavy-metal-associated domain-containing protein [Acidobacteriota bacterium]
MPTSLQLVIGGMHCGSCVRRVAAELARIDGVLVEDVQLGRATVTYDPAACTPEEIAGNLARAGFDAAPA